MTEDDYLDHRAEYDGICIACGAITVGGVEPDAEGYMCEGCWENKVFGIEQALMLGRIKINRLKKDSGEDNVDDE
jgi:hypothetical protein